MATTLILAPAGPGLAARTLDRAALESGIEQAFPTLATSSVPFWELGAPDGDAVGIVLLIHGGSWFMVGPEQCDGMRPAAQRWQARGWATLNIDYRPYVDCLADVLAFHDALRAWVGPAARVGTHGSSAGGHLALMVAVERDAVEFVVAEAAPTDLSQLGGTPQADEVRSHAVHAFGAGRLELFSPARRADEIEARVLLATCTTDDVVPVGQMAYMVDAAPRQTTALMLEPGTAQFVHADVAPAALAGFHAAEAELASQATATGTEGQPAVTTETAPPAV